MDSRDFDRIARVVGSGQSRRRVFKILASGTLGAVTAAIGVGEAAARARSVGNACRVNSDCASGRCVAQDRGRAMCACVSPTDCPEVIAECHVASCTVGICGATVSEGVPCGPEDLCNPGSCQADGACVAEPVSCAAADDCHINQCNAASGLCESREAAIGSTCADGNPLCNNGACCTQGRFGINGGCFRAWVGILDCPCNQGAAGIDGSPITGDICLVSIAGEGTCETSAECPSGQACLTASNVCVSPC